MDLAAGLQALIGDLDHLVAMDSLCDRLDELHDNYNDLYRATAKVKRAGTGSTAEEQEKNRLRMLEMKGVMSSLSNEYTKALTEDRENIEIIVSRLFASSVRLYEGVIKDIESEALATENAAWAQRLNDVKKKVEQQLEHQRCVTLDINHPDRIQKRLYILGKICYGKTS